MAAHEGLRLDLHQLLLDQQVGTDTLDQSVARKTAARTRLVLRFVDLQRAAIEVLAVQRLLGARRIGAGHLDEAEAAGTALISEIFSTVP